MMRALICPTEQIKFLHKRRRLHMTAPYYLVKLQLITYRIPIKWTLIPNCWANAALQRAKSRADPVLLA